MKSGVVGATGLIRSKHASVRGEREPEALLHALLQGPDRDNASELRPSMWSPRAT